MSSNCFVVRVYGIYIEDSARLLVSDEFVFSRGMTKFPGGGLEYGEGLRACLEREFLEETGQEFEILEHFFTTDFFVSSEFHDNKQLISVYYFVRPKGKLLFPVSEDENYFLEAKEGNQRFRWIEISRLKEADFTFPVDKHVAKMLMSIYS